MSEVQIVEGLELVEAPLEGFEKRSNRYNFDYRKKSQLLHHYLSYLN